MWRFRGALPPVGEPVTLGEGGTPLVDCPELAESFGAGRITVKNEAANPTLSFKDRAMALGVSLARDEGAPGVAAASTGNTAVSAAAYAARAGLPCRLTCARDSAGSTKLRMAAGYGARVAPVAGDFSAAHAAAARLEDDGWYTLTTTFRNPYLAEAHRSAAFEIAEDLGGMVPDWVVVPVGAGPLLWGLHQGFSALAEAGAVDRVPRIAAVQAEACAPIVEAWELGRAEPLEATPGSTVAGAIADPLRGYTDEARLTLEAIRASRGAAVRVGDDAILDAASRAATTSGLLLEPAAASGLAAIRVLAEREVMAGASVLAVATGHGAKEPW